MKLSCLFGHHKWEHQTALINGNDQCANCGKWVGNDDVVQREREAWVRILASTSTPAEQAKWIPLVVRELMKDT